MKRVLIAVLLMTLAAGSHAGEEEADPPPVVEVHVSFVRFPSKVIERAESMKRTGVLPHGAVKVLWEAGEGELLHTLSVTTRSGVSAEVRQVREIIYPAEYHVDAAVNPKDKAGQKVFPLLRPSDFETREVGYILNVTPTVSPDGQLIDLTLSPEHSRLEEWVDVAPDVEGSAFGRIEVDVPKPVFASMNITTSVLLRSGESVIIGGCPSQEGEGMAYIVLSAAVH